MPARNLNNDPAWELLVDQAVSQAPPLNAEQIAGLRLVFHGFAEGRES